MVGTPFSGACARCKARHVKCDEAQPSCWRCIKAKKPCPGYANVKVRKFLDEGVGLRKKFGGGKGGTDGEGDEGLRIEVVTGAIISEMTVRKDEGMEQDGDGDIEDEPQMGDDSLLNEGDSQLPAAESQRGLQPSHASRVDVIAHPDIFPTSQLEISAAMVVGGTSNLTAGGSFPLHLPLYLQADQNSNFLSSFGTPPLPVLKNLSFEQALTSASSSAYSTEESYMNTVQSVFPLSNKRKLSSIQSSQAGRTNEIDNNHQMLFLLRHFVEVIGPWLDLYDFGKYFSSYIAVKAIECPLQRYSAAAIAAKQLGRVRGAKAVFGGVTSRQAAMEIYPNADKVNWLYIAADYYDKAIACLREDLMNDDTEDSLMSISSDAINKLHRRRRLAKERGQSVRADELLAGTSILSVYEFMDDSNVEWSRHLSGVKFLLDEAKVNVMPRKAYAEEHIQPSRAQTASFWNFARCDYLAAFINRTSTRLDTEDLSLWRAAGILIDDRGLIEPSKWDYSSYYHREDEMREDMVSNALVWLLSKIMNYIAVDWEVSTPASTNSTHDGQAATWKRLDHELTVWYDGLCGNFHQSGRLDARFLPSATSTMTTTSTSPNSPFPEIFYSIPMCAATMQHYHMARILLLLHKPPSPQLSITRSKSFLSSRLHSYREITKQIAYHCREICGIALGRPPDFVRIHMLQPLFVAGQCLEDEEERKVVLGLLRGIEWDLGWATGYRVRELIEEWGWENGEVS